MHSLQDSWVEQIYKYVEGYYWVPQYLNKNKFQQVREHLRRDEIPLNALFNIFIRLIPSRMLGEILFLFGDRADFGNHLSLADIYNIIPEMGNFTQPDVTLESERSRIFIEMKVKADFSLQQVYKYIFLHAWWLQKTGVEKQPYLLLLSPKSVDMQWKSIERQNIFQRNRNVEDILPYLKQQSFPSKLGDLKSTEFLHQDLEKIMRSLQIGWTSWNNIGSYLKTKQQYLKQDNNHLDDSQEVIYKLVCDFLEDLQRRNLSSIHSSE